MDKFVLQLDLTIPDPPAGFLYVITIKQHFTFKLSWFGGLVGDGVEDLVDLVAEIPFTV